MTPYTIDEILAAFSHSIGSYPRAHVDAALMMRAEMIPRLIELLEVVRSDPARFADDETYTGHFYATLLLAFWGETSAHETIVSLFRLPERWIESLFSDFITEDLAMVLYRTCSGSLAQIKALALDSSAYSYCRSSALRAMSFALAEGTAERAEVLDVYRLILRPDVAAKDPDFTDLVLNDATELRPIEFQEIIEQGFAEGWLEDGFLANLQAIKRSLRGDEEAAMERLRRTLKEATPANFHRMMEGWAMFDAIPAPVKPVALPSPAPPKYVPDKPSRQQRRRQEREQKKVQKKRR